MAQGSELGVVTGMVLECSQSVWRWSGVRVEIHGCDNPLRLWTQPDDIYASPLHLSLTLPQVPLLSIQSANPFHPPFNHFGTSVPNVKTGTRDQSLRGSKH